MAKGFLQFVEIDLDTRKVRKIDRDGKKEMTIVGADKQHFYYIQESETENLFGLYKYNIKEDGINYLGNIPKPMGSNTVRIWDLVNIWDNKLFCVYNDGDMGKIIAYDFDKEGRVYTIKDDIPLEGAVGFSIRDVNRNVIQMALGYLDTDTNKTETKYIIHDMYSGYTGPHTLTVPNLSYTEPVGIVGEYKNDYIVGLFGHLYMDVNGKTHNDKQPGDVPVMAYYLINKTDYLTGKPNYMLIDDVRWETSEETEGERIYVYFYLDDYDQLVYDVIEKYKNGTIEVNDRFMEMPRDFEFPQGRLSLLYHQDETGFYVTTVSSSDGRYKMSVAINNNTYSETDGSTATPSPSVYAVGFYQ